MKFSERTLRQILHIAFPRLYDLAVAGAAVQLTLHREDGRVIGDGIRDAKLSIVVDDTGIRIVILPDATWKLIHRTHGKVKIGIAAGEHVDFIGPYPTWGNKHDSATVSSMMVSVVVGGK